MNDIPDTWQVFTVHLFPSCPSTSGHVPEEVTYHLGKGGSIFLALNGTPASCLA